ncbi:MAG: L-2-amino-thiazoline-4-carboxylic acid hydrolase [Bacillota bacterium]|nr:L-2-amino-thiazoline-4-carboxylic acid hydrolase [Bacillota bacterium]MDW7684545.1 L-2-amino-thiazoline-4-carboxylic acid hydrolase [Bacillota bacterium]
MNERESEVTRAYRSAIADRATWFYLLLKAADEEGADTERIAENAIWQFGVEKGKKLGEVKDAADFAAALFSGYGCGAFAMEKVEQSEEKSVLRFHHCELVEAWRRRGLAEEEISRLCRLARYGDLGMVSNFPNLSLSFPSVIADGDAYCTLEITADKKK